MKKRAEFISSIMLVMVLSTILLAACGPSGGTSGSTTSVSTPDTSSFSGQALLQARCTECHSTRRITTSHYSADQWTQVVDAMINRGASLNSQEKQTLIEYLAQTYP